MFLKSGRRTGIKPVGLALLLVLAMLVVTAGCGSTPAADNTAGNTTGNTTDNTPKEPVVVRIGQSYDLKTLDPIAMGLGVENQITGNVYDGLLQYQYGGTDLEPALATDWEISEDGLTYTFNLRKGVKFHGDYGEMTSADVKFSLDRCRSSDAGSIHYQSLESIESIDAPDDYTVVLNLSKVDPDILNSLANPWAGIVSQKAVEQLGADFSQNPVGTGPFAFDHWTPSTETVLVANKDYWAGAPKVDQLVFVPITESATAYMAFENGDLDVLAVSDGEHYVQYADNSNYNVVEAPALDVRFAGFTQTIKPMDDINVRKAMNYGFDRDKVIHDLFGDISAKATGFLPPGTWGYEPNVETYDYDLDKAKEYLAKSDYPDGFDITMELPNMDAYTLPAQAFQENMRALGINVTVQPLEVATYLSKLQKGEIPIWLCSWGRDPVPDQAVLQFYSPGIPLEDIFGYKNDQVDSLIEEALGTVDEQVRLDDFSKIQKQVAADAVGLWIDYRKTIVVTQSKVKGLPADPRQSMRMYPVYVEATQ